MSDAPESDRTRYEFKFDGRPRDRRVAAWIDKQIKEGRDAKEIICNILDEIITGKSSITGKPIEYQGEVATSPLDAETAEALENFSRIDD